MEQLVKQVQEKTGLGEEQARTAVVTVLDFLKDKLPAPVAGQIDGALGGAGGMLDQAGPMLGGLFGGNKQ